VGIGLLKEGDDASCNFNSRPFGAGFYERPIMCSYIYRRSRTKKVTSFSKISKNSPKTPFLVRERAKSTYRGLKNLCFSFSVIVCGEQRECSLDEFPR
jgi:hypothetical protein